MRVLGAIAQPEAAVLPVALPVAGSTPLSYVDRAFLLREQTPEALCDYEARKAGARQKALLKFATLGREHQTREVMLRLWSRMMVPVILQLLSEPADGGSPATADEVLLLTHTRRTEVLEAQETLSGLEECLGNAESLFLPLLEHLEKMEAEEQASA